MKENRAEGSHCKSGQTATAFAPAPGQAERAAYGEASDRG